MTFLENYVQSLVYLLCASMLFIPLERLLPRVKGQKLIRKDLKLDVSYVLFGRIIIMAASFAFVTLSLTLLSGLVPEALKSFVGAQPIWAQVIILFVACDFYYYWAHRLFHTVPFLWKFHAIHHSIEEMDWIAAHRTHPIDTAITNSGIVIISYLLGFSPFAFAIFSFQFFVHSLLKHSNVNVGWGPLRWLLVTPTFHHWHHANEKEAYDKNFAGQFPLWDVLFGTAIMKEHEGPKKYGVDDPVPLKFLPSLIYPFVPSKGITPKQPDPERDAFAGAVSEV